MMRLQATKMYNEAKPFDDALHSKASIVVFKEARSAEGPKHFDFLKWSEGGQRPTEGSVFRLCLLCTSGGWSSGVEHRRVMARHAGES